MSARRLRLWRGARSDAAGYSGQNEKAGQPWEKAKGFDNSCPLSGFIPVSEFHGDPQNTALGLKVNGEIRQQGSTAEMIHHIVPLVAYMSRFFTLKAGDVILTGDTGRRWPVAKRRRAGSQF